MAKKKVKAGRVLTNGQIAKKYVGSGLASEITVMPDDTLWLPSRSIHLNYTMGGEVCEVCKRGSICKILGF